MTLREVMTEIPRAAQTRDRGVDVLIRSQLATILSSETFSRSDRLSAFLTFVVEQTLDGKGDTLKEQVIALELYGKGADFNTAGDPIVRVDARRLRDRLREYYSLAPLERVVISVPKGSYTAHFEVRPAIAMVSDDGGVRVAAPSRSPTWHGFWRAGAAAVVIGAVAWLVVARGLRSTPPVRLLKVTSFPGSEGGPSFSPDGNFVVLTWSGPDFTANGDLWVKAVEDDALRRLTDTPAINEVMSAWSPDGRSIAFVRYEAGRNRGVYVMSALGGSERKVSDEALWPGWLPDSQSLVFVSREGGRVTPVQFDLATAVRRPLTTPPAGFVDTNPRVSPDGRTLAFVRSQQGQIPGPGVNGRAVLFVVPMAGGDPVRLDDRVSGTGALAWTPDSREILYPRWDAGGVRVFRVSTSGGAPVAAAELPSGEYGVAISAARPGGMFRVALIDAQSDVGLRLIDLHAPQSGRRLSSWMPFSDSTRIDWPARFSRDGTQLSFTSNRNGLAQIFAAGRDAAQVHTLTTFDGGSVGLASWSPDGRFLVFEAVDSRNRSDLYVVGADGGPLRRLTNDDDRKVTPEWSRDGRWIYYASEGSGRAEIWKIPAAGGTPVQLTRQGGSDPRESPDGRSIFFLEPPSVSGGNPFWTATTLKRMAIDGGNVSTVISGVRRGRWDVADTGIVFLRDPPGSTPDPATPDALEFFSFDDAQTRELGEFPFPVTSRGYSPPRVLTVSPDRRWVVVSHMDHWARDIVVADNFR
jgi:Tol biopolymer transport system component